MRMRKLSALGKKGPTCRKNLLWPTRYALHCGTSLEAYRRRFTVLEVNSIVDTGARFLLPVLVTGKNRGSVKNEGRRDPNSIAIKPGKTKSRKTESA